MFDFPELFFPMKTFTLSRSAILTIRDPKLRNPEIAMPSKSTTSPRLRSAAFFEHEAYLLAFRGTSWAVPKIAISNGAEGRNTWRV
jgi:hypothetical protein